MASFDKLQINMFVRKSSSETNFNAYRSSWWEFNLILGAFHRLYELKNLVAWAKRKRLKGVERSYQLRVVDEENTLFRYRCRSPHLYFWARVALVINHVVSSETRFYKGYAAKYRYSINLT